MSNPQSAAVCVSSSVCHAVARLVDVELLPPKTLQHLHASAAAFVSPQRPERQCPGTALRRKHDQTLCRRLESWLHLGRAATFRTAHAVLLPLPLVLQTSIADNATKNMVAGLVWAFIKAPHALRQGLQAHVPPLDAAFAAKLAAELAAVSPIDLSTSCRCTARRRDLMAALEQLDMPMTYQKFRVRVSH